MQLETKRLLLREMTAETRTGMKRFYYGRTQTGIRGAMASLFVFFVVLLLFLAGLDSASDKAKREQKASLETSVWRSITQYYAIEGRYPESLDVLKEEYGLQTDYEEFFVDYQVFGANLMPDVTVLERT